MDTDRVQQIITNLLSNAVKYSPEGETVSLHCDLDNNNHLCIAVIDRGPGIAPEDQKLIFEKFRQAGIRNPFVPTGRRFRIVNHYQIPDGLPKEIRSIAQALALRPNARRALYSELRHMRTSAQQLQDVILPPDIPL